MSLTRPGQYLPKTCAGKASSKNRLHFNSCVGI